MRKKGKKLENLLDKSASADVNSRKFMNDDRHDLKLAKNCFPVNLQTCFFRCFGKPPPSGRKAEKNFIDFFSAFASDAHRVNLKISLNSRSAYSGLLKNHCAVLGSASLTSPAV